MQRFPSMLLRDNFQVGGNDMLLRGRDKPTLQDIKRRYEAAVQMREQFRCDNNEVANFFLPKEAGWFDRSGMAYSGGATNRYRYREVFDFTGQNAIRYLAESGMERLMPVDSDWFSFVISPTLSSVIGEGQKALSLKGELERYSGMMRSYLGQSNFRRAMQEALRSYLTFGWCAVLPRMDKAGGLVFDRFMNNCVSLEQSISIDGGVFWEYHTTVRNWNREYPFAMLDGDADEAKSVVHAAIPMGDVWMLVLFVRDREQMLFASIARDNPVVVGKMPKAAGETYPTGYGAEVLPEVKMLSELRRRYLQLLAFQVSPMFVGNSAANIHNFNVSPGNMILVDGDIGSGKLQDAVMPLPVGGNPNAALVEMENMREKIRSAIGVMPIPTDVPAGRTATEWLIAREAQRERANDMLDNFRGEVMLPCIRRAVDLMRESVGGVIPDTLVIDGRHFDINVTGASERARKVAELQDIGAFLEYGKMLPPEEVMATIDFGAVVRRMAGALGMGDMALTEEESLAYREQLASAVMNQQQAGQGVAA